MTSLAVLVPVKSAGKSRLSPVLSAKERMALADSLFRGVMASIFHAGLMGVCKVVSSDRTVLKTAEALGAAPVVEPRDSGVNSAVRAGMRDANGADEFLVLPSDLPLLNASDLSALLQLRESGARVVITPSVAFDGTNALLFPRSPSFPLSYDSDSFWTHLSSASALGLKTAVCARGGIMFDVDTPGDLRRLAGMKPRRATAAPKRGAT